jgi:23S rRNA (adenine2503-C2)-methyltransferase
MRNDAPLSDNGGMKHALAGMFPEEVAAAYGLQPWQGRQIFRWIHQRMLFDFDKMTDLSKALRAQLKESALPATLTLLEMQTSERTGTKKALLQLADGECVEAVLIRAPGRVTLCLSSQVGCPLKCSFCATGLAGFTRNLEANEIVEQALFLLQDEELEGRTPNIVYMGMGEPLRNYDNVMRSIRLLMHPDGLHIGARKITVSTAGEVPGIERFAQEAWQVRLSISLHAANDTLRDELVPLNRRYNLSRLRGAIEKYLAQTGRQITFEWTLLDGVNDRPEDAQELIAFARGLKATVNLIPWNPVSGLPYRPSPLPRCRAFAAMLHAAGLTATLRAEKGQDIDAACGQLRRTHAAAATG